MIIRQIKKEEYRLVEEMIKETFWNLYIPGCSEHYLAHYIRNTEQYIPSLDLVLIEDNQIIGNIMYVKSQLINEDQEIKDILSFGPFTIKKEYQRKGYGRKLLEYSLAIVKEMGYDVISIWGNPENYVCYGFKNCKRYNIYLEKDIYPVSLMVKVLNDGALKDKNWQFIESKAYQELDLSKFEQFDQDFKQMEKGYSSSQELFYIYSRSNLVR